jgi:superfamily II DNA or RNA helicase
MNATNKGPVSHNWRLFEEARAFVHGLGLNKKDDWKEWVKSGKRPKDIPSNPNKTYKDTGWKGWGDWLGTGRIASFNMVYRSFAEARSFVHNLELQSKNEWMKWAKSRERPDNIPANPVGVYKSKGWVSWGDWLGTNRIATFNKVYRPFQEAREFAHALGLNGQAEWQAWIKKDELPGDIPSNPQATYKDKGWAGWGDWLGTGRVATHKRKYLPFEEAREYVRSLKLNSQTAWRIWVKTNARLDNIPADPIRVYENKGWESWRDWLGTDRPAPQKIMFLPFDEARSIVHTLRIKSSTEWKGRVKNSKIPDGIPYSPSGVYRNKGWKGWGDWLGTGRVAYQNMAYRTYKEARAYVNSIGLRNKEEWKIWSHSDACPSDIPSDPQSGYKNKGWTSWADWLGTRNRKGGYRAFEEARTFVQTLKLQNQSHWRTWAKGVARPDDIPADPQGVYNGKGWLTWGDWLGTKNRKGGYLSFEEARSYVRSLGLKGREEWPIWAGSDIRPDNIPASPNTVYLTEGWAGWGDWLGIFNRWNKNAILSFLNGIKSILKDLQPSELYAIMRQNSMIASASTKHSNTNLIKNIRDLCSSPTPENDFEKLVAELENQVLDKDLGKEAVEEIVIPSDEEASEELPALRSLNALKAVDTLVEAGITSDEETIEFLVVNRVSGLWQDVLNKNLEVEFENLRNDTGGVYFNTIRSRFLSQYDGAQSLAIPLGYNFRVDGRLAQPNLMQLLAAYRILTEKRLGNWSGVGAGKTLSAILASRVIDAHLTIIVAFNSTVQPWATRIKEAFPDSIVHIKERGDVRVDANKHTYLVLNFETFQQPDSVAMVQNLIEKHKIDFVVLDEIQSVKQRTPKVTSKRRQVVSGLLSAAGEKNPDLCVLGMSATPVINNLYEAKALLELVKGLEFNDLKTFSSIANASAMHEKLILYGIRYRPEYRQTIETEFKEIEGNEYLSRLRKVRKGAILDLEKVLLDAKIETIISSLRKGTLIYTHYLTGLVGPLRRAIEKVGFKVGLFTGEDKSGLDLFKKRKVDVLIGSIPVGTGVDGLQYICNRMIIVSLPWTSAEYEQLIGRLYRQGSAFDKVEVIIPQVVLEYNSDIWSWDKMRMHRIQYKKTLADAALDGVIPQGELASPETMFKQAREALQAWIARIENEGVTFIERSQLLVPLPKETAHIIQRRFGDLSMMNSRFNTAYSKTTHERLNENPEEWYLYHTLYREARKTWEEIPFEKIARSVKKRPDWVIGDFGCGEAKLAEILSNKVHSFDHIAINEKVTACDIAHIPLEDEKLDIAVFSLSLMGLNYPEYLKEAYRTLKFGGMLKIAEPINRWQDKREELLSNIAKAGFLLIGEVGESNQFFYVDAIKTEV